MYTLRVIYGDGTEVNIALGQHYTVVKKEISQEMFDKTIPFANAQTVVQEDTYAFITSEGGRSIHALHPGAHYFVMTDSGKTFSNLTLK